MAAADRLRRKTERLRERVLETAEQIIATEGVRHATMRRIASAIDYAPTVLYRLFASKDDLMDHLIVRGYDGVRRRYDEVLGRDDLDPLETLAAVLWEYSKYALEHPHHYQMWFATGEIRRDGGRMAMRHGRLEFNVFQVWFECIESCRERGLFPGRDSHEVFEVLWPRVHGVIALRLQHPALPWPPAERHLAGALDLAGLATI